MKWFLGLAFLLVSCGSEPEGELQPEMDPFVIPDVSFQQVLDEVVQPKCVKCHEGFKEEEEFLKHGDLEDPAASPALVESEKQSHPRTGLEEDDKRLLRRYFSGKRQI